MLPELIKKTKTGYQILIKTHVYENKRITILQLLVSKKKEMNIHICNFLRFKKPN